MYRVKMGLDCNVIGEADIGAWMWAVPVASFAGDRGVMGVLGRAFCREDIEARSALVYTFHA